MQSSKGTVGPLRRQKREPCVCTAIKYGGKRCNMTFAKPWNLRRHMASQHPGYVPDRIQLRFIHMVPRHPDGGEYELIEHHDEEMPDAAEIPYTTARPYTAAIPYTGAPWASREVALPAVEAALPTTVPRDLDFANEATRLQRRRPWLGDDSRRQAMPVYEVRRSGKCHMQARALEWLSKAAADAFGEHLYVTLGAWGVKPTYKDNCLLLTADWAALDPATVMSLFSYRSCPLAVSPIQGYQYADHRTGLCRAIAWFSKSPRSGMELDNFTGAGPFKSMQASHLCHHPTCVIPSHIVYEAADVNEDRKRCHLQAIFLRSDHLEIPELCSEHEPGCLLRHACRTTYESHLIQFSVLRRARGIPEPAAPPRRPRRHRYNTFICAATPIQAAHQATPQYSVARFDDEELQREIPPRPPGRPDIICPFCQRIKAFHGPVFFWTHLVNEHDTVEEEARLEEIRRTASLWKQYWTEYSDAGRRDGRTITKLNEALSDTFTWRQVLDWDL